VNEYKLYEKKFMTIKNSYVSLNSSIKYDQMIAALEYRQLTGQNWEKDTYLKDVALREK